MPMTKNVFGKSHKKSRLKYNLPVIVHLPISVHLPFSVHLPISEHLPISVHLHISVHLPILLIQHKVKKEPQFNEEQSYVKFLNLEIIFSDPSTAQQ